MIVTLSNGGATVSVDLPHGTEAGHIRSMQDELDDIGAPSSFTLAVDGQGVDDSAPLSHGATVTFRPRGGDKGSN